MRKLTKILLIPFIILFVLQGCYDDYFKDFEYSAVYFAVQDPFRTVLVENGKELKLEIGTVLGGKYSNNTNETVQFKIAPELLDDYPQLELLPEGYYSLSNQSEIVIPSGEFLGTIDFILNENFLKDKNASELYYALPVQIVSASTDSILVEKDHTIIAIKYQNKYYGSYWVKGVDETLNDANEVIDTLTYRYSNPDLVTNLYTIFSTTAIDTSLIPYVGLDITGSNSMKLAVNNEGGVNISTGVVNDIGMVEGSGNYNSNEKMFYLNYSYEKANMKHQVRDTLYYFHTPMELDTWMKYLSEASE